MSSSESSYRARSRSSSSTPKKRRVREKSLTPPPAGCICLRPYGTVICTMCGWVHAGRVRTTCPLHSRTMYLLDIDSCPKCRAYPPIIQEIP